MTLKHNLYIAGIAAGVAMPAAALQDERQRGTPDARWTSPGWYLVDYRGSGQAKLLAGPFAAEAACREARGAGHPPPPRGHPELDTLDCRELRQAP